MTDKEKLQSIDALLSSGVLGINSGEFVVNQTAILAAMAKTDRELLVRICSQVEKTDARQLLEQTVERDLQNLTDIMNSTEKIVT